MGFLLRRFSALRDILKVVANLDTLRILAFVILLILGGTVGIVVFEEGIIWSDALWYSFVTITTVGYGDFAPATIGGRVVGVVIMTLGIGILSLFTANIASFLVEQRMKRNKGMQTVDFTNHLIICEWNRHGADILEQLRKDPRRKETPIVLVAELQEKPLDDANLHFINGEVNEDNLKKANLADASTAIVLGNDRVDASHRDAKVVLDVLTIETLNPDVYTVVELQHDENVKHCERANADEIIVGEEFSSKLISRAVLDHGISKVLSELVSSDHGNDLSKIPVPQKFAGKPFLDVFTGMKREHDAIVLALQKSDGSVVSNPKENESVDAGHRLIIISGQS